MKHEEVKKLEENMNKYKKALSLVYADGDLSNVERNRLISLKKELGLSDSLCMAMESHFLETADLDAVNFDELKKIHHCHLYSPEEGIKWHGINSSMLEYIEVGDTYIEASNGSSFTGLSEPFALSIGQSFVDLLNDYGAKHIYDAIEDGKLQVFDEQSDLETYLMLRFDIRDEEQVYSDYTESIESGIHVNYAFTEEISKQHGEIYSKIDGIDNLVIYEEPRWSFKDPENNIVMDYLKEHDSGFYEEIKAYIKDTEAGYYFDIGKSLRYDDCYDFMGDFSKESLDDKLDDLFIIRYSSDNDDGNMGDGGEQIIIQDKELSSRLNSMIKEHVQYNIQRYNEYKKARNEFIDKELADKFNNSIDVYTEEFGILKADSCPEKLNPENHLIRLQEGQLTPELEVLLGFKKEGDLTHNFGWFKYAELNENGILVKEYPVGLWDEKQDSNGNPFSPEKIDTYDLKDKLASEELINKIENNFKEKLNEVIQEEIKIVFEKNIRHGVFSNFDSKKVLESMEKQNFEDFEEVGNLKVGSCDFNLYLGFAAEEPNIFISPVRTKNGEDINGMLKLSLSEIKKASSYNSFESEIKGSIIGKVNDLDSLEDTQKTIITCLDENWLNLKIGKFYMGEKIVINDFPNSELNTLKPFEHCNIEMYFNENEKKWNAQIHLQNKDIINLSFEASENDLKDFWYGFEYNGNEYDMNICDGSDYGNGGWIYPVDKEGHVDTLIYEQMDSVNIYSKERNNLQVWEWKDYNDLSGHLVSPDGKSYFSYDWTTKEYKRTEESSWDSFLDADPARDTSLAAFKEYAQIFVKKNLLQNSDLKIVFENKYIDIENLQEQEEREMAKNETFENKYSRMKNLFEEMKSREGSGEPMSFEELYKWTEKEFSERDSAEVLRETVSRMIMDNVSHEEFNVELYDDIYGFGDGADFRWNLSDKAADALLSGDALTLAEVQKLIFSESSKMFAELKENPNYKNDIEITDRINAAFRISKTLYPDFAKLYEHDVPEDGFYNYTKADKKAYIEKAWETIQKEYSNTLAHHRVADLRTDGIDLESVDRKITGEILTADLVSLIKGHDAVLDGEKSLDFIRPNKINIEQAFESNWKEFDAITTGYSPASSSSIKDAVNIEKIDDMDVFDSDIAAAKQYGIDHNVPIFEEKQTIWIGDDNNEYFSFPDTPENRKVLKSYLIDMPVKEKFDWSEFTEKGFDILKHNLDAPKEKMYGSVHIGSISCDLQYREGNTFDLDFYVLGEEGIGGEVEFDEIDIPYSENSITSLNLDEIKEMSYEQFKDWYQDLLIRNIEEENYTSEARRPTVNWSNEEQCKELYRKKLVESATINEIVIAPYSREKRDIEAVRYFLSKIVNLPSLGVPDDMVYAVLDNIGRVQDDKPGDFLKIKKDGSLVYIMGEGNVTLTEPIDILHEINTFAEEHAALAEEGSEQKKDFEYIKTISEKVAESIINPKLNPTEYVLNKLKEKGIEVITDKIVFDELLKTSNIVQKMVIDNVSDKYFLANKDEAEAFSKELDAFIADFDKSEKTINPLKLLNVGSISPVMRILGIADVPVGIDQSTISKALREEPIYPDDEQGHKLTINELKNIPQSLADPVMVFRSDSPTRRKRDSYVFFTERKDENGNSIIIPVAVNHRYGRLVINKVTSIYGKDDEVGYVKKNIQRGNLVYFDKKRSLEWERECKVQFLAQVLPTEGSLNNILSKDTLVKFLNSKPQNMVRENTTYGFAYEGKIYLNPDIMNSEVAVHEYTHLWDNLTRKENPELWNKGLQIFKGTSIWNEVVNDENYADIKDDENLVLSECHARITGKVAEEVLRRISEMDGTAKQADMIDWDRKTIDFIYTNYRDVFAKNGFETVAEFAAASMKELFNPNREIDSYNESINYIKEQLEKESGIKVNERLVDEIYSRYEERDLQLEPFDNGLFRITDTVDGKYTNLINIQDVVKQVIAWDDKELSELHAGTADDDEINIVKGFIEDLEHLNDQITYNHVITNLDFNNKEDCQKVKEMLDDDFKITDEEAKVLLTYATHFDDGTHEYGLSKNGYLYFRTNQDNEGWSLLTKNSRHIDFLTSAFDGAAILLDSDMTNDTELLNSFIQKNETLLKELDNNLFLHSSLEDLNEIIKENDMESKYFKVTQSVTFPCGFIYPDSVGKTEREQNNYRKKIYKKLQNIFGFADNDTETSTFRMENPKDSSFNIHFAVSVPEDIKTDVNKVNAWVEKVEKFVKKECGCSFINWQGGERYEQTFVNEKQYKMWLERNNDFNRPNAEDLEFATINNIKEYCLLNSEIKLSDEQVKEIAMFYDNNDQFSLYVSPAGNLYERNEYEGNLVSADAELLKAGNYLRTLEGKERFEYLLKNTTIDEPEWSNGLLNQTSNDSVQRLKIVSDVLSESFATLDRHDGFWQLLLNYGADPTRAIRIAAEDANLGDNLNWLLNNVPESHLNQIFSDNGYADAVFDIAKESVTHDMDSWIGGQDIGFSGFKRIARLCGREADADRYYGELLEKAFECPVEPKIVQLLDTPELLAEKMNNSKIHPNEPTISRDQASSILDYCNYEDIKFYVAKDGKVYSLDVSEDYNGEGLAESNFGIVLNGFEYAKKAQDLDYSCYSTESFNIVAELWQIERQFENPSVENTIKTFTDDIDKMRDFDILSKEEFLASYDYLTEEEYDATAKELKEKGSTGLQTVKHLAYKEVKDKNYLVYDNRLEKTGSEADKIQAAIERLTEVSLPAVADEIGKSEDEVAEIISALLDAKDYIEERFNVVRPTADEIIQKKKDEVSWSDILKSELSWKELGLNPDDFDRAESGTETERDFKEWAMSLALEESLDFHDFDTGLEGVSSWNNSEISEQKWIIIDKLSEAIVSGKLKSVDSQAAFDNLLKENEVYKEFVQNGIIKEDFFGLREASAKEINFKLYNEKEDADKIVIAKLPAAEYELDPELKDYMRVSLKVEKGIDFDWNDKQNYAFYDMNEPNSATFFVLRDKKDNSFCAVRFYNKNYEILCKDIPFNKAQLNAVSRAELESNMEHHNGNAEYIVHNVENWRENEESNSIAVKEPVEIIKDVAIQKELAEVPKLFTKEFNNRMKGRSAPPDPFKVARSILKDWQSSIPEYVPVLNTWLKTKGCSTVKGFEDFFKSITDPEPTKKKNKDYDLGPSR